MNKTIIAIAATLFAIPALFASSAQAGGRHGFHIFMNPAFHMIREYHNDDYTPKYRKARKVYVTKKRRAKVEAVAKAEEKVEDKTETPVADAVNENSSITTASGEVAETKTEAPKKVAAIEELGCKKFFPTVGMTLSVPCE